MRYLMLVLALTVSIAEAGKSQTRCYTDVDGRYICCNQYYCW